ncbi:hypothetical protein [Aurantibacter sp.]|uniref:hypothetical protein n=1 Tax=Aurantibacter sp. TaxID=2807103 RepID=UPI003263C6EB
MKKVAIIVLFIFCSCKSEVAEKDLNFLNGYWEIEEVIFTDGSSKEYGVNTSVDFIKIENKKGFRKKVQPKLDGTFNTTNDTDIIVITDNKGRFSINYTNNINEGVVDQRSELLVALSENNYSVRNLDGITYHYKRFQPFNILK